MLVKVEVAWAEGSVKRICSSELWQPFWQSLPVSLERAFPFAPSRPSILLGDLERQRRGSSLAWLSWQGVSSWQAL